MLEIQKQQFNKALGILNMLGCEYAIKLTDGQIIGKLPVADAASIKVGKNGKVRKARKPSRDYSTFCIPDKVNAMGVGDVLVIEARDGFTPVEIQANVCTYGVHRFGKGNFTTTNNKAKNCVEAMRLG